MALDYATFTARFPEFATSGVGVGGPGPTQSHVEAKLAEALRRTDADIWGDQADDYQGYLAADLLYNSVFGYRARQGERNEKSPYRRILDEMVWERGRRGLVIYGPGTTIPSGSIPPSP